MPSDMRIILETRWTRCYAANDRLGGVIERSRFLDGDANITLAELKQSWHSWQKDEKIDFCQSFSSAKVPERLDIVRFLIANGDHSNWRAIAYVVTRELPSEEYIPILANWCQSCPPGEGTNYYSALASTGDPAAYLVLKSYLERIGQPAVILDENNISVASDALECLMLMLGLKPDGEPVRYAYEILKKHPSKVIREGAEQIPKKYFEYPTSVLVDSIGPLSLEDQQLCDAWRNAETDLGIRVTAPLTLNDGETTYHFAALVHHFGHPDNQKGLVLRVRPVVFNPDQDRVLANVTSSNGFLLVTLAHRYLIVKSSAFKTFLDQFRWYGPEGDKPSWYRK
jgi:hypothetical protein